jgi:hypothetical protein
MKLSLVECDAAHIVGVSKRIKLRYHGDSTVFAFIGI